MKIDVENTHTVQLNAHCTAYLINLMIMENHVNLMKMEILINLIKMQILIKYQTTIQVNYQKT